MENSFINLYNRFSEIKKMGWIKSRRKGSTGIGYTFESLLNIEENSLPVPDYDNIEIKTMRILSKRNIHLFNAQPDGDFLYPTERILDILGYPCKKNKDYKVFMSSVTGDKYSYIGYSKKIKLQVDRSNKKINLLAKDYKNNSLPINVSWSFDLLKRKLLIKNKYLAIVKAKKKFEKDIEFFHYVCINFYILKDFETFLSLIENGTIVVTFKINVYLSDDKKGRIDNHGTDFSIKEEKIELLYDKFNIFTNFL